MRYAKRYASCYHDRSGPFVSPTSATCHASGEVSRPWKIRQQKALEAAYAWARHRLRALPP